MKPEQQKRIQRTRNRKAETIRQFRTLGGLSNSAIRRLAAMQHGESERVKPETLADYYPLQREGDVLAASSGDYESWTYCYLLPPDWTDKDIADRLHIFAHYGGPGRGYANEPWIERSKFSTLVRFSGGLDI